MRRHLTRLVRIFAFVLILAVFSPSGIYAQEPISTMRSNVIKEIGGREFYIHTIKKGQSLYMIAKAYGIDVNTVIRFNPEVKEGILSGQKIRIPVNPAEETPKEEIKPVVIPEKPKEEAKPEKPTEESKPEIKPEEPPKPEPPLQTEINVPVPALPCGADASAKKEIYDIALMIPLYLSEVNEMNEPNPPPEVVEEYNPFRFIQFYEGFRLAADSLEKAGIHARIHVYDAIRDTSNTRKILSRPEMKKMDLIIGLVYQKDFQVIAGFGNKNNIPVVNPLSEREQIIEANPAVIKVRPPLKSQVPELAAYLGKSFTTDNIIIIRDAHFKESAEPENLRKSCSDLSLNVKMFDGYSKVFEILSKEKENVLIVYSDNKVFALEFLTKMNEFRNTYRITVIGLPKWDEMDGLEPEYLVNMKTHIMSSSFVDYEDPDAIKFVMAFREKYKTDPDLLAFQGFDVTSYFLTALGRYGKSLDRCLPGFIQPTLESSYRFTSTPGNGLENQHWEIYKYENYRILKVN